MNQNIQDCNSCVVACQQQLLELTSQFNICEYILKNSSDFQEINQAKNSLAQINGILENLQSNEIDSIITNNLTEEQATLIKLDRKSLNQDCEKLFARIHNLSIEQTEQTEEKLEVEDVDSDTDTYIFPEIAPDKNPIGEDHVIDINNNIIIINNLSEFNQYINTPNHAVVVYFTANWCGPCKRITPIYKKLSLNYPNVLFLKVDVDHNEDIVEQNLIRCMPTFKFYWNGQTNNTIEGASPRILEDNIKQINHTMKLTQEHQKYPAGSWIQTARNIRLLRDQHQKVWLTAELQNCRGQWIANKTEYIPGVQYSNIDGTFQHL